MTSQHLPAVQQGFHALSNEQQIEHRRRIALRCEAILGQFWRDDEADAIRALQIEGYVDVLQHVSHPELRDAWADYQRSGPRSSKGRLLRPDAGALYALVVRARRRNAPLRPAQEPASACQGHAPRKDAAEILAEIGFNVKRFSRAEEVNAGLLNEITAEIEAGASPAAIEEVWGEAIANVERRWPDEGARIRAVLDAARAR